MKGIREEMIGCLLFSNPPLTPTLDTCLRVKYRENLSAMVTRLIREAKTAKLSHGGGGGKRG